MTDSANVELVRQAYDAYNRRDAAALQGLCHEHCTIYTVLEGQVEPQPFRGRDGIREWIDNEDAVWESVRIDELELRELDDHRVFTAAVAFVVVRRAQTVGALSRELPFLPAPPSVGKRH